MLVIYMAALLAACSYPFFIERNDKMAKRIFYFAMTLVSLALLIILVEAGMAGIPSYSNTQSIAIGSAITTLAVCVAKLRCMFSEKKKTKKTAKTHKVAS